MAQCACRTWALRTAAPRARLSPLHPAPFPAHPQLRLQQTLGNRSVERLARARLKHGPTVGPADDAFEHEADRVAEQVLEPAAMAHEPCAACAAGAPPCPRCALEKKVRLKPKAGPATHHALPERVLGLGAGQALPSDTRAFFEQRFGADLGAVQIHADRRAATAAAAVEARAFTLGPQIVFGSGEYAPGSAAGRRLLAHELAHVLQDQRGAVLRRKPACPPRRRGESQESEKARFRLEERAPEREWLCYGFAINSASLDPAKGDVRQLARTGIEARILRGRLFVIFPIRDRMLEVLGYTDCHGSPETNAKLREARAANFCAVVREDTPLNPSFFRHQISSCRAAPLDEHVSSNDTPEGREQNRGVLIRVVMPQHPGPRLPYDPTYGPEPRNCAAYLLARPYFNEAYANNAYCACTHTPDEPHNNCVRKCLQEKMRGFLADNHEALRKGEFVWCPSIWKHHRECYAACACDNQFIDYLGFAAMCEQKFSCPAVGISIALLNRCMEPSD